ncbi:MAG: Uma2 family endonuclease [Phormidesmis sp. CAN_BIN36]|nr:Uma2 family endonuclease [Phormidesmis sp. CAN_BIN36]
MTASTVASLQELEADLPEGMESVDGNLIEKTGMTLKHGSAQAALAAEWRSYGISSGQGGKAYTEVTCRTDKQKHRPDVAYLTAELIQQFGQPAMFPQSFPLIAEVASPDDSAEALFAKAQEYLRSGAQEVWLLFPETLLVMIVTPQKWLVFAEAETASTQTILPGFSIPVKALFA